MVFLWGMVVEAEYRKKVNFRPEKQISLVKKSYNLGIYTTFCGG